MKSGERVVLLRGRGKKPKAATVRRIPIRASSPITVTERGKLYISTGKRGNKEIGKKI